MARQKLNRNSCKRSNIEMPKNDALIKATAVRINNLDGMSQHYFCAELGGDAGKQL